MIILCGPHEVLEKLPPTGAGVSSVSYDQEFARVVGPWHVLHKVIRRALEGDVLVPMHCTAMLPCAWANHSSGVGGMHPEATLRSIGRCERAKVLGATAPRTFKWAGSVSRSVGNVQVYPPISPPGLRVPSRPVPARDEIDALVRDVWEMVAPYTDLVMRFQGVEFPWHHQALQESVSYWRYLVVGASDLEGSVVHVWPPAAERQWGTPLTSVVDTDPERLMAAARAAANKLELRGFWSVELAGNPRGMLVQDVEPTPTPRSGKMWHHIRNSKDLCEVLEKIQGDDDP